MSLEEIGWHGLFRKIGESALQFLDAGNGVFHGCGQGFDQAGDVAGDADGLLDVAQRILVDNAVF